MLLPMQKTSENTPPTEDSAIFLTLTLPQTWSHRLAKFWFANLARWWGKGKGKGKGGSSRKEDPAGLPSAGAEQLVRATASGDPRGLFILWNWILSTISLQLDTSIPSVHISTSFFWKTRTHSIFHGVVEGLLTMQIDIHHRLWMLCNASNSLSVLVKLFGAHPCVTSSIKQSQLFNLYEPFINHCHWPLWLAMIKNCESFSSRLSLTIIIITIPIVIPASLLPPVLSPTGSGRVFVRGFDFGTTDEQLQSHMSAAGAIGCRWETTGLNTHVAYCYII